MLVGHRLGDVGEQPGPVERLDLDRGDERPGDVVVPFDLDEPLTLARRQRHRVCAVGAVHRHATAARDEPHDLVAGHRRAAARQAHHDVVEPFDVHTGGRPLLAGTRLANGRGQLLFAVGFAVAQLHGDARSDRLGRDVVLADGRVQRVEVGVVQRRRDLVQQVRRRDLLNR